MISPTTGGYCFEKADGIIIQTNPEPQLEGIEGEQVSETRKMIEKFVDENPEAVANLLRNWLNEEWG